MLNLKYDDLSLEKGIKEIWQHLQTFLHEIIAEKSCAVGYIIEKSGLNYIIKYGSKPNFFHALFMLVSTGEISNRTNYSGKVGIMLDCARNAVPTVEFLKDFIKKAALSGYDYIGLYLEDLLEIESLVQVPKVPETVALSFKRIMMF